jgi:hypothetical protein
MIKTRTRWSSPSHSLSRLVVALIESFAFVRSSSSSISLAAKVVAVVLSMITSKTEARTMKTMNARKFWMKSQTRGEPGLRIPPYAPLNPSKEFDLLLAKKFRRLSGAAYCAENVTSWTCEYCDQSKLIDVEVFESQRRQVKGFVGFDSERGAAVVSFRGTEPTKFENWIENLDATHAGFPVQDFRGKGRVHSGFLDAYVQVRMNLTFAIERLSEKYYLHSRTDLRSDNSSDSNNNNSRNSNSDKGFPVEITGHSLGGALATIAALDLDSWNYANETNNKRMIKRKIDIRNVYTFGSPRVGDFDFAEVYAERLGFKTYRITHGKDVVPSVPNTLLGYRHVPTEVYEDRQGNLTFGDGSGEWIGGEGHVWRRYSINDHLYYLGDYICGCGT